MQIKISTDTCPVKKHTVPQKYRKVGYLKSTSIGSLVKGFLQMQFRCSIFKTFDEDLSRILTAKFQDDHN